jgi:hypothetical protein
LSLDQLVMALTISVLDRSIIPDLISHNRPARNPYNSFTRSLCRQKHIVAHLLQALWIVEANKEI